MARGDHAYVARMRGLYSHHGIDCGDGSVIHELRGLPLETIWRLTLDPSHLVRQRLSSALTALLDGSSKPPWRW